MIRALGKFDYENSIPFECELLERSFPEFSIKYIDHYNKNKQYIDKETKKKVIGKIYFDDSLELEDYLVFQWID